jgi:hypothetical protein
MYPGPGIEKLINAVERVFPDKGPVFQIQFIERVLSHYPERLQYTGLTVPFFIGLSRHHRNMATTRITNKDWKNYLMHAQIGDRYFAVARAIIDLEMSESQTPEIEKFQSNGYPIEEVEKWAT